ncbi:MAG: hypothetical protein ABJF88_10380 [Rhodothermales bacterium]
MQRALAVLVLVGYALVLAGSSAGHGWSLLVHLVTERHEAESVAAYAASPHAHPGSGHAHGNHAHGDAPHEHDGRTHTHERDRDADPDAPAVLTVSLDKHCLFSGAALPPLPVRDRDDVRPTAALFSTAPPVEVLPPRALS